MDHIPWKKQCDIDSNFQAKKKASNDGKHNAMHAHVHLRSYAGVQEKLPTHFSAK